MPADFFRQCSTCRQSIAFQSTYYRCSVSTCNRKRATLAFCSVDCWEAHVPVLRHRDAWAEKDKAPTAAEAAALEIAEAADSGAADRSRQQTTEVPEGELPQEVLVIASKLKSYIRAKSGMNCSDNVLPYLSQLLRDVATQAIRQAALDGRRTVLDRDVQAVLPSFRRPGA